MVTYHPVGNDASDGDGGETILWARNGILDDLVALIFCLSISLSDTLEIVFGIAGALNLGARHDANPGCRRMFRSRSWEEEASQDSKDLKECCADPWTYQADMRLRLGANKAAGDGCASACDSTHIYRPDPPAS